MIRATCHGLPNTLDYDASTFNHLGHEIKKEKKKDREARRRASDLGSGWHGRGTEGMAFGTHAAKGTSELHVCL